MTRLPTTRARRAGAFFATCALVVGIPAFAFAQGTTHPVVDSAPRKVRLHGDATIEGHLENGTQGQEVGLQRRLPDERWRTIESEPVNDRARVRFALTDLRLSSYYRLVYVDPSGVEERSDRIRIGVVPVIELTSSKEHVMVNREIRLSGTLFPKSSGREVVVQQRIAGEWRRIGRVSVRDGRFARSFTPHHHGFRMFRARFAGDDRNSRAFSTDGVRIYEPDPATWYGPGFYGNRTACGKRLQQDTLGVAHRRLPCGTDIAILYQGRTITVPVIDRGPYGSADWDLTEKTADRLGFEGTDTIGVDPKS